MALTARVPLVDLAAATDPAGRSEVVDTIGRACEDSGFLIVTGHGVDRACIDGIDAAARAFFALPLEDKMRCARTDGIYRGYTPAEGSALAASRDVETPPDLCELYTVNRFDDPDVAARAGSRPGREAFFAPNVWPREPTGFKEAFEAYYAAMEDLALRLMRLMALALDLDEHWFDHKIADHITNLAVNHYPALHRAPAPGQLRRGAHSDWGSLTILGHDGRPGLQILSPDGEWEDVPTIPDSFVINLGDLMATWTNDRWVSTMHRVVVPDGDTEDRVSIAFFHQPSYDALIECIPTCAGEDAPPRHETTTSGEWILSMLQKTIY